MRITILNGNPDAANTAFESYLARLTNRLQVEQHTVTHLLLREMDIRYCTGCFGCWVKRPGQCLVEDDSQLIRRSVINSDLTLWASPLLMGFPSALLKKVTDKLIPLVHPYMVIVNGETHHLARYDRYPRLGLLVEPDGDEQAVQLAGDIFSRTALNFKSRLDFVHQTTQPVEDLVRLITAGSAEPVRATTGLDAIPGVRIVPPTRLTVFNGSPRGRKSNTNLMLEQFTGGFTANSERSVELFHLNHLKEAKGFQQAFAEAECVWLGFPLYTDAMPGIVKAFIETLEPFVGRKNNPPLGFLVQSGFPEAAHSRHVERYLQTLAARLGSPYLGTLVKGNGEGTRITPRWMTAGLFKLLFQLGATFGEIGQLDPQNLRRLARPEHYPAYLLPFYRRLLRLPLATVYFDQLLKTNGVYEQRFARPYLPSETQAADDTV